MRSVRRRLRSVLARSVDRMLQRLLPRLAPSQLDRLLEQVAVELESKTKMSLTYHRRPLLADGVGTWSDPLVKDPECALVVQGPIIKANDFTLNSVRIYRKNFRNTHIILSTWDDENDGYLNEFRREGVKVISNNRPENSGVQNINLQIVSSFAGIQKARELGATYVLKTRSDQRLYAPNIPEYLCNLLEVFPAANGYKQRKRLIGVSLNTFKYRLYGVSDMFLFGHIGDMLCYWGCQLDDRRSIVSNKSNSVFEFAKLRLCEVYLATEYLTKIGHDIVWTLHDSWQALADHFVIVNKEDLDLFWPKYARAEYRWLRYAGTSTCVELGFREWFNLYADICNKRDAPTDVLDLPFNVAIEVNDNTLSAQSICGNTEGVDC